MEFIYDQNFIIYKNIEQPINIVDQVITGMKKGREQQLHIKGSIVHYALDDVMQSIHNKGGYRNIIYMNQLIYI